MSSLKLLIAVLLLTPAALAQECPRIEVMCPTEKLEQGTPMTFGAKVSGGGPGAQFTFNWSVSAGTIMSGQGSPMITVDTVGLGGQNIKVTVDVGGLPGSCAKVESCEVSMAAPQACGLPLDRYSWGMKFNDEKARLDNFAIALRGEPAGTGYILITPGKRARPDEVRSWAKRARSYLTNRRGVDPERFVIVHGADTLYEGSTQLLIVPRDVKFPFPGKIIK